MLISLPVKASPQQKKVFQLTPEASFVRWIVTDTNPNPKHYTPAAKVRIKLKSPELQKKYVSTIKQENPHQMAISFWLSIK